MRNRCASGRTGSKEPDKSGSPSAWGGIIYRASMKIVTPATADRLSVTITSRGGVTYVKGMTSVSHHPKGGVVYIERKDEDSGPQAG